MNNNWWQELLRFFLHKLDINRVIHMLIIFIVLVVLIPDSFKQALGSHNPEFLPAYAIYYLAVFCLSFFLSAVTSFTTRSVGVFFVNLALGLKIKSLSATEKECLSAFLQNGKHIVYTRNHNPVIELLVHKKILQKTYDLNCTSDMEGYTLSSKYNFHVIKHLQGTFRI